ncbi:unnamed protein product [Cyclocybe aegerita]|uniref:XPG-I domain-containing protein n=1 Tax=Cyclocybe aegerita TaxID=1973307 RepID=A0A8S0XWR8_CYCAE|nr:unnamed protein product [Cyclocybe aegerita]
MAASYTWLCYIDEEEEGDAICLVSVVYPLSKQPPTPIKHNGNRQTVAAGEKMSLQHLAVESGFLTHPGPGGTRSLWVGVDALARIYRAIYRHGKTKNPELATLFARCARLFKLPICPLFVFDGPGRPKNKRGKKVRGTRLWLEQDFKTMLDGFGFTWIEAPLGEAEAELASLATADCVDVVLSEDLDCFIFGGPAIMRFDLNTSNDEEVILYRAAKVEAHPDLHLEHADFVFIALTAGGDYGRGIPNCGIDTAFQLAKTGLGQTLLEGVKHYQGRNLRAFLSSWHKLLILEAATNKSGHLPHKYPHLARSIPANFPTVTSLNLYTKPLVSGEIPPSLFMKQPDPPMLASFAEHRFVWGDPVGILKHFSDTVFPGLATRSLMSAAQVHDLGFGAQSQTPISHVIALRAPGSPDKCPRHQEVRLALCLGSEYINRIVRNLDGCNSASRVKAVEKWMKDECGKVKAWVPLEMVRVTWPALLSPYPRMSPLAYAGINKVLEEQARKHQQEDIEDDLEGEQETLPDLTPEDLSRPDDDDDNDMVSQW